MALTFAKKAAKPQQDAAPQSSSAPNKVQSTAKQASKLSWMKTGAAAHQAVAEADAKQEMAKLEMGKLWRFWMPADGERKITFLDGNLDAEGMLDIPMYHEHGVKVAGEWKNFVCVAEQEGHCPICERGEYKASLVGVMTVVDHTPHTIKQGQNAGKVLKNTRKLFVPKRETLKQLTKIAVKRGGLAGCTFDVTRGNEKTAAVGNQFDFVEKQSLAELAAKWEIKADDVKPADYQKEITYHTGQELIELGVGKGPSGPGYEKTKSSLEDEL